MEDATRHLPPKGTSGAGFAFEDRVVAYLAARLMASLEPWPGSGRIVRIACQQGNLGWKPDDVVLTMEERGGAGQLCQYRCAGSIKDMPPLTRNGFAAKTAFREEAWALHGGEISTNPAFDPERDCIVLFGNGCGEELWATWQALELATQTGAAEQLALSIDQRSMFNGMSRSQPPDAEATAHFLRRVRIIDVGRHRPTADICRDLLRPDEQGAAEHLEQDLLGLAQDVRHGGGSLDLSTLVQSLRARHALGAYADHRADWKRLLSISTSLQDEIPIDLGGYHLQRDTELAAVAAALEEPGIRAVAFVGESGCGKTVIAKRWLEARGAADPCSGWDLWWDNGTLDAVGETEFRQRLGLTHSLAELCAAVPVENACLVLDNADRLPQAAWDNVGRLLRALDLGSETTAWRLVVTCEAETWPEVHGHLEAAGMPRGRCTTVFVTSPELPALATVLATQPVLRPLFRRPHLSDFLRRPKVLAVVLGRLGHNASEPGEWVSEPDVIDWLWHEHVDLGNAARSRAAQRLGVLQAERPSPRVPVGDLGAADLGALDELRGDGICRYRDDRYTFAHDLYGDWARLRYLLSRRGDAAGLLGGLELGSTSLLWQRALRLYGLHLLDKEGAEAWRQALDAADGDAHAEVVEGRLLESLALASSASGRLDELWPVLAADEGRRLRRFLTLFLTVATEPFERLGSDFRLPRFHLWAPVLAALLRHGEDVARVAPAEFADLAAVWLLPVLGNLPLSDKVAEAAISQAEKVAASQAAADWRHRRRGEDLARVYKAALQAAPWQPDRVAEFALDLAQRRGEPDREPAIELFTHCELPAVEPWPDGPLRRVDETFRQLCLDELEIVGLIRTRPAVAREVLLAVLIAKREPSSMFEYRQMSDDRVRVEHHFWRVHFHDRGPFWVFLHLQPTEGLELILRLVNFATERWLETVSEKVGPIDILPWGTWLGDYHVFRWYRDEEFAAGSVAIALMALEKWLYDLADKDGIPAVEPWLAAIVEGSHSVAFAGLLAAVAVRHPELLRGTLRPLLTKREFVLWDGQRATFNSTQPHINLGHVAHEPFWEWHRLPHRDQSLLYGPVYSGMLFEPDEQAFFAGVRQQWFEEAEQELGADQAALDGVMHQLDPANYRGAKRDDGRFEVWYEPPPAVRENASDWEHETEPFRLWCGLTIRCRKLLDSNRVETWQRSMDPWAEPDTPAELLSDDEAEDLWQQAQHLEAIVADAEHAQCLKEEYLPADALCGVAAVLVHDKREWLRQWPERETWCSAILVDTVLRQPGRGANGGFWEHADVQSDSLWNGFCAETLPRLMADEPQRVDLRRAVGLLATDGHYSTVETLMRAAGPLRASLGDHFGRLRRLTLNHAVAMRSAQESAHEWERRWNWVNRPVELHERRGRLKRWWRRQRLWLEWRLGRVSIFDLARWRAQQVEAFMGASLPPTAPPLDELVAWPSGESADDAARRSEHHALDPRVDLSALHTALAWLPPPDAAFNEGERAEFLAAWREIAEFQAHRLSSGDAYGAGFGPQNWDDWAKAALAQVIARMRPEERPEDLWQPLLRCGSIAPFWLDYFLQMFFHAGLQEPERTEPMVRQWQAMIDFALSERVLDGAEHEVQAALMGSGRGGIAPWRPEHAELLLQMRGHLGRWAAAYASNDLSWGGLVRFLRLPTADRLRLDGLCWLADARPSATRRLDERTADSLVALLELVDSTQRAALQADGKVHAAFRTLLDALGDHPRAARFR